MKDKKLPTWTSLIINFLFGMFFIFLGFYAIKTGTIILPTEGGTGGTTNLSEYPSSFWFQTGIAFISGILLIILNLKPLIKKIKKPNNYKHH